MPTQPEALLLANELEDMTCLWSPSVNRARVDKAAAELRRLHAENALLGNAADKLRMAWRDEVHCLMQDKRQLIAQRGELLRALERLLQSADVRDAADAGALKQARDAIKAVEGETK